VGGHLSEAVLGICLSVWPRDPSELVAMEAVRSMAGYFPSGSRLAGVDPAVVRNEEGLDIRMRSRAWQVGAAPLVYLWSSLLTEYMGGCCSCLMATWFAGWG
jgi:hypothetical protein